MKTDKFDDAIRQKLESIELPFRERDWAQMQSYMHRHGYPSPWSGAAQWFAPMAAAAAITGLIVATVWQYHTNQTLKQSVQKLNQTVARLETTQATLIKQHHHTDTVYVLNSTKTTVPFEVAQPVGDQQATDQFKGHVVDDHEPKSTRLQAATAQQPVVGESTARLMARQNPSTESLPASPVQTKALSSLPQPLGSELTVVTPANRSRKKPSKGVVPDPATESLASSNGLATTTNPLASEKVTSERTDRPASPRESPVTNAVADKYRTNMQPLGQQRVAMTNATGSAGTGRGGGVVGAGDQPTDDAGAARQIISIPMLTNRPPVFDSSYYVESMARRQRRIRSLLPATVVLPTAATAPTEIASSRAAGSVKVRLGVSAGFGGDQQSKGGYGEVVFDNHWSVGIGLNKLHIQGGKFNNEEQFEKLTHTDFRRLYAPIVDPKNEIININQQFTVWQIPLNLSYRGLLGKGFAIIPAIGMDISISAQENTTFTYWRGVREIPNVSDRFNPYPRGWFNTYTFALGAEKSWKHVVLQAGPVLSAPTLALPNPLNPTSLNFRARLLYQF